MTRDRVCPTVSIMQAQGVYLGSMFMDLVRPCRYMRSMYHHASSTAIRAVGQWQDAFAGSGSSVCSGFAHGA